eukprot:Gb_25517 [translate_table: standard]
MDGGVAGEDMDYAFQLQLQEALAASVSVGKSDDSMLALKMQGIELERYDQEVADDKLARKEMQELCQNLCFPTSDEEAPSSANANARPFKLYFKGLVGKESIAALGVVILDIDDQLVFRIQKPLSCDISRAVAEYMALNEGLSAALTLGIRNITIYGDSVLVYNQVFGYWKVRQQKIAHYFQQVTDQLDQLDKAFMVLLPRSDNKLALKLARDSIDSQLAKKLENHHLEKSMKENCGICLEDNDVSQMFEVMNCLHRFCLSCMSQHVEVKLRSGCLPNCPYDGCNVNLTVDHCRRFLPSKWIDIMTKRLEEAAIPEAERVYFPYPYCSALMSKGKILVSQQASSSSNSRANAIGSAKCQKCNRLFCVECRVPWHARMTCQEYQRRTPHLYAEDAKLHSLASDNRWRRCKICKHMIELVEGCYHMTCRCGHEFCYICGAEWRNKKATCTCKLWDEHNIIRDPLTDTESEDEDETDDDYDESDSEFEYEDHY